MTRSEIRQIIITLTCCAITASGVLLWNTRGNKKIAVVDAIKLFNDYKMKKELEAKSGGKLQYLSHIADSLKNDVMAKSKVKEFPRAELEQLYKTFSQSQAMFEQEYQQSNQAINEQVWKRLNPLIDEYGKREGLRLIIGANGMGSVLYNDEYYDKTKELTDFVNKKYEEGN